MQHATIALLRALIVTMFLGLLLAQAVVVPLVASETATLHPEVAHLRLPLLTVAVVTLACVQVALVCVSVLLSMVEQDRVSSAADRYVDGIIGATVVATVLVTGVNAFLTFVLQANPPGILLALVAGTVGGAGLALLMVVMKALLRKAAQQRAELVQAA